MVSRQWAASGKRPSTRSGVSRARPAGSWDAALDRARREWDGLTCGPDSSALVYSDEAAAAILALAVTLWPQVASEMAEDASDD